METAVLCLEIFLCRILDVSCSTVRTVLTVKEKTGLSAAVGFFEAFIWFVVVRQALQSANESIFVALAYGAGFAAGTYVGGKLAKLLIKTNITMQVVTSGKDSDLIKAIQSAGFAVTVVEAKPTDFGPEKYMLFSDISSQRAKEFKKLVYSIDPCAFIMIQETKQIINGFIRK